MPIKTFIKSLAFLPLFFLLFGILFLTNTFASGNLPDSVNGHSKASILYDTKTSLEKIQDLEDYATLTKKDENSYEVQAKLMGLKKQEYKRWVEEYGVEIFNYTEFLTISNSKGLSVAHIAAFSGNFTTNDYNILTDLDDKGWTVAHLLAMHNKDWYTSDSELLYLKTPEGITVSSILNSKHKIELNKKHEERKLDDKPLARENPLKAVRGAVVGSSKKK
jgi:hypothetical protein